ncbi:MAG: hypothetical protein ACREMR_06660, partial [Gemmatimonadales bacterium]
MPQEKEPNWDQEMREVNRLLARLPEAEPGLIGGPRKLVAGPTPPDTVERARRPRPLATWVKVGLAAVFTVAVWQWPYRNDCGSGLAFYLVGVGTVVVAGVWCLVESWRSRLAFAHVLSLLVFLAGLVLMARAALPRTG